MLFQGVSLQVRVYVDGFNLYYGAVKGTPYKWLDLVELARQLVPPGYVVDKLKYFTARVSGVSNKRAPARQQAFLSALRTLPEVEIHTGSFVAKRSGARSLTCRSPAEQSTHRRLLPCPPATTESQVCLFHRRCRSRAIRERVRERRNVAGSRHRFTMR